METNEVNDVVVEQKATTLKSLEKDVSIKLQEIDIKLLELDKKIETVKKSLKTRRM